MSDNKESVMDMLTTEMMEHLCDNLCMHPNRVGVSQEELDEICDGCKMGHFVCGILNEYNRLNDFEKTQCFKLLQEASELKSKLNKCQQLAEQALKRLESET